MKIALVYDRVNKWGGAERVLLALHEMFPEAPLYTSVYNAQTAPWAKVFTKIIPSFLQKVPFMQNSHEFLAPLMPIAFESFDFSKYDLLVSVTSEAAKGIIVRPPTKHVCYCLTPTRYLWSHHETYFKDFAFKSVVRPLLRYLKGWDKIAANRPDVIIAISTSVQKRIKEFYGRDSEIIYPPVEIDKFKVSKVSKECYLLVSRLVKYKKVDLVIKAFNESKRSLVIVGTGRQENFLKSIANNNIKFLSNLTDSELASYYQKAKALIFPQEEDFGLVAIEAQASGTPVIAYKSGGALDTVIEGRTGVFFDKQDVQSLNAAIKKFSQIKFKRESLTENAKRFSKEKFKKKLITLIDNV